MLNSEEYILIRQLLDVSKEKVKNNVELYQKMEGIIHKIDTISEISLPLSISQQEIAEMLGIVTKIENNIRKYTTLLGGGDLDILETIKKEITYSMSYLTTFRDRFIYELEFLEEVFKKEIFSQLVKEISTSQGMSVTQAEKVIHNDERYKRLRRDLHNLKLIMGGIKTKYTFFEKSLQLIIQSVSVAGKELHNSKLSN